MSHESNQDMMSANRELSNVWQALDKSAIVAITDQTGKIIHVNDKFCEISKYSREELLGQNHRIINSGYHPKSFFAEMWKTISSGKYWEGEICNRAKDGHIYWVNTAISPFLTEEGKPYQYVSIRYEITQRKNAESQIIVQDRLASLGLLSSSLAHEIGTPLGVIRGRAEYISAHVESGDVIIKNMEIIISQIDRISKLIGSLLNLARGDQIKSMGEVRLELVVSDVLDLMGYELKKNGVEIKNELIQSLPIKTRGGSESLHQVLLNLVVNALHAIQSAIEQGRKEGHFIRFSIETKPDKIALCVEDSGCGISKHNMRNLFKPFFTTKDVGSGTGLGLATSYRIVESWGGSIAVESEEGKGTQFKVFLPLGEK